MPDEPGQGDQRPQNWLLGSALTALTTILAALGAVQLGMDRMLRNRPWVVFASFFLVILAAVLGGIALTLRPPTPPSPGWRVPPNAPRRPKRPGRIGALFSSSPNLIRLGLVCFGIAGILAVLAAVRTPSDDEFPSITTGFKLGENPALTASIKAGGLSSGEDLDILIDGLNGRGTKTPPERERLYNQRLGPSPNGRVDLTIELPLTPATYDRILIQAWVNEPPTCDVFIDEKSKAGCLVVLVPNLANRPQLSATWGEGGRLGETLSVKLTGRDMRVDKSVAVSVVGTLPNKKNPERTLAQSVLVPNSQGILEGSLRIPVAEAFTRVCVAAITVTPPATTTSFRRLAEVGCPPKAGEATVWTMLRVPPRPFQG